MLDEEQRMRKDARGKTRFHSCRGGTCYHQVSLPPQQRFLYQTISGQKSKCECTAIYKPYEIKKSGQKQQEISVVRYVVKRRWLRSSRIRMRGRLTATADPEAHGTVAGRGAPHARALGRCVAHPRLPIVSRARFVVESHNLKHAEH